MPVDTPNGDGSPYNIDRRLEEMSNAIAGIIQAVQVTHKAVMEEMATYREVQRGIHRDMLEVISKSRDETQDLLLLQREHRIDIMVLL